MNSTSGLLTINTVLLSVLTLFELKNKKPAANTSNRSLILDSCGLIDGRIIALVEEKLLPYSVCIPIFVLDELQTLADSKDEQKRFRGRQGLETAAILRGLDASRVIIDHEPFQGLPLVDKKLLALTRIRNGVLYTTDYNLQKIAAAEGFEVLNVHELAGLLRPRLVPGEMMKVRIIQKGTDRTQGVGYTDDGTMVVVDGGYKYRDKFISVKITKIHQTASGRMAFANVEHS